jgi:hypothetical protein
MNPEGGATAKLLTRNEARRTAANCWPPRKASQIAKHILIVAPCTALSFRLPRRRQRDAYANARQCLCIKRLCIGRAFRGQPY